MVEENCKIHLCVYLNRSRGLVGVERLDCGRRKELEILTGFHSEIG
jgi:hypothetical protein